MAKLKPWYQVVNPREDLRDNRPLDASEFAVHLDHIHQGLPTVPEVYRKPERFFERTVLTKSLLDLSSQVARRLNGITVETSAVFNMATQFGGGKTHSLTALYHLARGGGKVAGWKGVPSILERAQVSGIPEAAVAVFVGKTFDTLKGRGGEGGEPLRHTPWGEIAWQLGGMESYKVVEQHDREFVEPKGDAIRAMFPKDRPVLILMDEIISYVSTYRSQKYGDKLYNFLDCLAEEARGQPNVVVVVSIPASELEYTQADEADEARFKKMLDRVGKAISMSSDSEVNEIIRRRLFEWEGLPQDALKTISAYVEWASEHAPDLAPMGTSSGESATDLFRNSYPFHPTVISVFERKWQTLPRFQRTRGILRLLALWVARAFQAEHLQVSGEPLITLGSAPLEDQIFRDAVFEQLGSDKLITPVTADIAGKKDSHAVRLDREASEAIKKARLHQRVATTIFFESNGGQAQARTEASRPEIRAALGGPDVDVANVETVLEGLLASCYYLVADRERYRFGLQPNLNQMLVHRRASVRDQDIEARIKQEITELFKAQPQELERRRLLPDIRYFPAKSTDIPDQPKLWMAVLGLDTPHGDRATEKLVEGIIREHGSSGRTFKSGLLFCVPESSNTATDDARSLLAWEDITDDTESTSRLDDAQKRTLDTSLKRAKKDLREALYRAYRHVYLLGKKGDLQREDLGQITSSVDPSIANLVVSSLTGNDIITKTVGPTKLVNYWPPALEEWSTKAARDAFYAAPALPRLLDGDTIKRTIADGVTQGLIGYARKDAGGRLVLDRFEESLPESVVEISDEVFIVKADHAKRLKEPPRLDGLHIHPDAVRVKPGEAATFRVEGRDQYGAGFPIGEVEWGATGGSIADGKFSAAAEAGVFSVVARLNSFEASAEIRIAEPAIGGSGGSATGGSGGEGEEEGGQLLLWSGDVPPQKWMNFYTKIVSPLVASSGVRLKVSFEADAPGPESDQALQRIKAALRDLGLDENAHLS